MQQTWDDYLADDRRLDAGVTLTDADVPKLRRKLRAMESARDAALASVERLTAERDDALATQTQSELALREAKNALQEVRRQLRHKDLEMREAAGQPAKRDLSTSTIMLGDSDEDETDGYSGGISALETFAGGKFNRADTLAALQAAQEELKLERQKRAALERKAAKGREKLHCLMADAERQKDALRILRKGNQGSKKRVVSEPRFEGSTLPSLTS